MSACEMMMMMVVVVGLFLVSIQRTLQVGMNGFLCQS